MHLRPATADDQLLIARALFTAWHWREPFDERAFKDHHNENAPDSYVDDFGNRPGDIGVIAEQSADESGVVLGVAWCRFFTADDHHPGYLADDVPELAIAVDEKSRGRGLGSILTDALIDAAPRSGIAAVSLHVSHENTRARHLYERCGFVDAVSGERGSVMVRHTGNLANNRASNVSGSSPQK